MPLNKTPDEINQQATEDFQEKLRLEKIMSSQLKSVFREMARDMQVSVTDTGQAQQATLYIDDFRGIHSSQARRVTNSFTGSVLDFLEENQNDLDENIIRDLDLIAQQIGIDVAQLIQRIRAQSRTQILGFNQSEVGRDTVLITKTNQKEMDSAVESVRADNPELNNVQVATLASRNFRFRSEARAPTISATFTQKIAENTKKTERENFFNVRNGFAAMEAGLPQINEEAFWVTRGDSVVRQTHLDADFTESVGGVFTVGGEQLRFPGDTSLGASAGNTINCRCSAVATIE